MKQIKDQMIFVLYVLFLSTGCYTAQTGKSQTFSENVKVTKEYDETSKTTYHLTRIKHTGQDGKLIKLRLGMSNKPEGESATQFASRMNTGVAFNASMGLKNPPPGTRQPVGIQIIDGKIIQELPTNAYTLGIKDNNELVAYPPGTKAKAILADGSATALTAFIPLILDHKEVSESLFKVAGNLIVKHPRQAIAQFDNGDILVFSTGGRGIDGEGMTAKDMMRIFKKLNVRFAFNLDGGGSVSTVVKDQLITKKIDEKGTAERPRPNFLYVMEDNNLAPKQQLAKALDIFLLIGQSNMQGVAPIGALDTIALKNVWLFNDKDQWEPARNLPKNGMNRYSTVKRIPTVLFGPAYTFGRKIAAYTGRNIAIVSNARGATRIEWWQKGFQGDPEYNAPSDFNLYEEAVGRAKAALAAAPAGSKIKGILWHQGEADNAAQRSPLYSARLKKLVNDLRKDLGDPNLPFIAGEVGTWNNRGLNINPVISDIKSYVSNSDWVSSAGLTSINEAKNDAHFDNLSQRVFGGRYADKTAALVYHLKPQGVTLFSAGGQNGRSVLLPAGTYEASDLESNGILADEIASVKADKGYQLEVYFKNGKKTIINSSSFPKEDTPVRIQVIKK